MNRRRLTKTETAEYVNKAIAVAGLAFFVPYAIWSLWHVISKGSIPYGRILRGATFASDPLGFILYILSHIFVLIILFILLIARVRAYRLDKMNSAEASNLHIAQISNPANNKKA